MTEDMTVDQKLAVLARAILALSKNAASVREFDGQESVSAGVSLDGTFELEAALEKIAAGERTGPKT